MKLLGFRVWGFGFRRFRVKLLGVGVLGLQGVEFGVYGSGCRAGV